VGPARPRKVAAQLHSFEEAASFTKKQTINVNLRAMTFAWLQEEI